MFWRYAWKLFRSKALHDAIDRKWHCGTIALGYIPWLGGDVLNTTDESSEHVAFLVRVAQYVE